MNLKCSVNIDWRLVEVFRILYFSRDLRTFCYFGVFWKVLESLIYMGVREMPVKSRDLEGLSKGYAGMGFRAAGVERLDF